MYQAIFSEDARPAYKLEVRVARDYYEIWSAELLGEKTPKLVLNADCICNKALATATVLKGKRIRHLCNGQVSCQT
jgi:hypothetical protein